MHKLENETVSRLTTMRIGGNADYIFFPESSEELISILFELKNKNIPWSILGAGSNTLASSNGVKGALICTTSMDWIEKNSSETIIAGAGTRLPKFAGAVAQMGLSGAEFYEGIPGSIGGAVVMNAGAHGTCTSNILEKIVTFDTNTFELVSFVNSQLNFSYRHSGIDPNRYIVLEAKYRLNGTRSTSQIVDTMREYSHARNRTQPKGSSSGCIFRNPDPQAQLFAGKLIDEHGLKGTAIGNAAISEKHGNFIINSSGASSKDICTLIKKVQAEIWQAHGIWMKPEVQPLGHFAEEDKLIWIHPDQRPANWLEAV